AHRAAGRAPSAQLQEVVVTILEALRHLRQIEQPVVRARVSETVEVITDCLTRIAGLGELVQTERTLALGQRRLVLPRKQRYVRVAWRSQTHRLEQQQLAR